MVNTMIDIHITSSSHMANKMQHNHIQLLRAMLVVTWIPMRPMEAIKPMLPYGIKACKEAKHSNKRRKIKALQVSRGRLVRDD